MFAVQNGLVWTSSDAGASWARSDIIEAANEPVSELHWSADYERVYAVGVSRGLFRRNVTLPVQISQRSGLIP
jgi:predicted peptidase